MNRHEKIAKAEELLNEAVAEIIKTESVNNVEVCVHRLLSKTSEPPKFILRIESTTTTVEVFY